ncbi:MAG: hypothetical protein ACTSQA_03540 [Candidatus Heimdallarchaeaceae archaeon]
MNEQELVEWHSRNIRHLYDIAEDIMLLGKGRLEKVLVSLDTITQIVFLALKQIYGDVVYEALAIHFMNVVSTLVNDDDRKDIEDDRGD